MDTKESKLASILPSTAFLATNGKHAIFSLVSTVVWSVNARESVAGLWQICLFQIEGTP
jgi:hypothetical protein